MSFLALSTGAYAVHKIGSSQIKNSAIKTRHLANHAVTAAKVHAPGRTYVAASNVTLTGCSTTAQFCGDAATNGTETNWRNYDSASHSRGALYKDASGVIHLQGLVQGGVSSPTGSCTIPEPTIFKLPSGYRPARKTVFVALAGKRDGIFCESNDLGEQLARVNVLPTGEVQYQAPQGEPQLKIDYLTLDGIAFLPG